MWGDLDARARGLATHLLTRPDLERLAESADPAALARALCGCVQPSPDPAALRETADVDRLVRRSMAQRMALLARWAGPRAATLAVVFEDEDRRSVRALFRGAAQGAPAEARLAGLVPTPSLAEGTLERLAALESLEGVVRGLADAGHPWGPSLVAFIEAGAFDLFTLEIETSRIFLSRAGRAARRGGRRLREHVAGLVDQENVWTAILAGGFAAEADPSAAWIDGGLALPRTAWDAAVSAESPAEARTVLAAALRGTGLGRVLGDPAIELSRFEAAALAARIADLRDAARIDPLGPAPLLEYALRLRAEALDLRRIAWGVALRAPAGTIAAELTVER